MKLDVQSLSVTLGENHILKDASFSIDSGEFVGISALMVLVKRRC